MDAAQVDALQQVIRRTIAHDLDELYARLDTLEERTPSAHDLTRRLAAVETLNGIRPRPTGETARQEQVRRLHEHGVSQRTIAVALDVSRSAVAADLHRLGLEPSADAVDAAGRRLGGMATRYRNGNQPDT